MLAMTAGMLTGISHLVNKSPAGSDTVQQWTQTVNGVLEQVAQLTAKDADEMAKKKPV